MIFAEWSVVSKFLTAGLLLSITLILLFRTRRKIWWLFSPLVLLGISFVLWGSLIQASNDETEPLFCPNGRYAVRTSFGPFGEPAIELFSAHGLRKEVVYWGDVSSINWIDNSHLVIEHEVPGDYGDGKSCPGSRVISVRCISTGAERPVRGQ